MDLLDPHGAPNLWIFTPPVLGILAQSEILSRRFNAAEIQPCHVLKCSDSGLLLVLGLRSLH